LINLFAAGNARVPRVVGGMLLLLALLLCLSWISIQFLIGSKGRFGALEPMEAPSLSAHAVAAICRPNSKSLHLAHNFTKSLRATATIAIFPLVGDPRLTVS
jgi:hypothetical protein